MKPSDLNKPLQLPGSSSQDAPVSKLRRVVDMTEINQKSKAKPAPTKPQKSAEQKQNQSNSAKTGSKPNHSSAQNGQNSQQPAPRRIKAPSAAAPKAPEVLNSRQESRPAPKTESRPHQLKRAPEPKPASSVQAPSAPAQSAPTQAHLASKPAPSLIPDTKPTKFIKSKSALHVAEKHTIQAKDKLKNAKFLKQPSPEIETTKSMILSKIDESLLLQSWRAKQWNTCIADLFPGLAMHLNKCLPLVQARLVNNICIDCGRLEATVIDQITSISIRQFNVGQWRSVINLLSDRAIFTTSLLNGELPEGILDVFKQACLSLFPSKVKDFTFCCECGCDENQLCEHVCALLLAFAFELEEDPFHIITLRGLQRESLLSLLRDARSDHVVDEKARQRINYEMPAQNVDFTEYFSPKPGIEDFNFHIAFAPNTLIKRLGSPSTWTAPDSLDDVVSPILNLAGREAENLCLGEQYQIPGAAEEILEAGNNPVPLSRAPKNSPRNPRFTMPDLGFIKTVLSPEILETVPDDPVTTAEDIIRWLKTRGASDIRTLARRTRLHKPTIEAFLNAFCEAGLTITVGEADKLRFEVTF